MLLDPSTWAADVLHRRPASRACPRAARIGLGRDPRRRGQPPPAAGLCGRGGPRPGALRRHVAGTLDAVGLRPARRGHPSLGAMAGDGDRGRSRIPGHPRLDARGSPAASRPSRCTSTSASPTPSRRCGRSWRCAPPAGAHRAVGQLAVLAGARQRHGRRCGCRASTASRARDPAGFADYADYVEAVDVLLRCGAFPSRRSCGGTCGLQPGLGHAGDPGHGRPDPFEDVGPLTGARQCTRPASRRRRAIRAVELVERPRCSRRQPLPGQSRRMDCRARGPGGSCRRPVRDVVDELLAAAPARGGVAARPSSAGVARLARDPGYARTRRPPARRADGRRRAGAVTRPARHNARRRRLVRAG
jgi:hypothetical protein